MEILIELKKYCIETASKKSHEKLIAQYFKKRATPQEKIDLEKKIEGIQFFIKNTDFAYLRNKYTELNGSQKIIVKLQIPPNPHEMVIKINQLTIRPKWKNGTG